MGQDRWLTARQVRSLPGSRTEQPEILCLAESLTNSTLRGIRSLKKEIPIER